MSKQTAVEWLYEKLEYVNWMRNRDEISSAMADEWRKHYLDQAKAMEREQIVESFQTEWSAYNCSGNKYYERTYGKEASDES